MRSIENHDDFFGGVSEQTRRIHNIPWGQITKSKQEGGLGFHTMRETNAAFLTKLGLRLMVEKDKLWSQVLRAKYCNGRCDVDMFQSKTDASNAWRGILENMQFLKKGMRTKIGNGAPSEQRKQDAFVRWHAPREDWIKLNIDGASKGNPGPSGGGGIFRDHYGNWIKAFACNFGWCTSVKAEVLALLKGLRVAWDMGYKKLETNLDSQITARKTQQPCKLNQPL
ncbi:hypothetical protein Cgig2_034150 [Carnegiea gigantea]|uniref:RNase H type-1 domain-containing protein n=1 Tax=Carnegiea gigantea TaxID=171969 RepID=A0A9Q1JTL7_9CARY|nr:hypothetical protein Cgig2_034150 [Carnegiea gigantea]